MCIRDSRRLDPLHPPPMLIVMFQEGKRVERIIESLAHRATLESAHSRVPAPLDVPRCVLAGLQDAIDHGHFLVIGSAQARETTAPNDRSAQRPGRLVR
eukprot:11821496-Alexandrium_andersonii.AAC.1